MRRGVATFIAEVMLVVLVLVLGVGLAWYANSQISTVSNIVPHAVSAARASVDVSLLSYTVTSGQTTLTLLVDASEPIRIGVLPVIDCNGTLSVPLGVSGAVYTGGTVLLPLEPATVVAVDASSVHLFVQNDFYTVEELELAETVQLVELYSGPGTTIIDISVPTTGKCSVVLHYLVKVGSEYYEFLKSQPVKIG